jgi:zinc D-Ala-D-Ala carboxypeptidase
MNEIIREPGQWRDHWTNFSFNEFKCSCCNRVEIASDLIDLLQQAREVLGKLIINSAYRCGSHNQAVSNTGEHGPHTTGFAVDIHISNSQHRKQLIDFFSPKVSGLGIAKTFIHIDLLDKHNGFEIRPNAWLY